MNKQLKTELVLNGESRVSLFEYFPHASFSFSEIAIKDILNEEQNLLEAESLTFLFNIKQALRSQYSFDELLVKNGKVNIHINELGQSNYDILKDPHLDEQIIETHQEHAHEDEGGDDHGHETTTKPTSIQLDKAKFENIYFVYEDEQSNLRTALQIDKADLNGLDYVGTNYQMHIKGNGLLEEHRIEETTYFANQKLKADIELESDWKTGLYAFRESKINLGKNEFVINGTVQSLTEGYDLDLDCKGVKLTINDFLSLFSEESVKALADWKINGDFDFSAIMKGKYKNEYYPNIKADFTFAEGVITPKSLGYPLKNFSCTAEFTNGVLNHANTSLFTLKQIDFNLLGNLIHFDGSVSNLAEPRLKGNINGKLDLYLLKDFAKRNFGINELEGELDFQNWSFDGSLADFKTVSKYPQSEGTVVFDQVALKYNEGEFEKITGNITAKNTNWFCQELLFTMPNSSFVLDGVFKNLSPFLLQWNDSVKAEPVVPQFEFVLNSEKLKLSDFEDFRPVQEDSSVIIKKKPEPETPELPPIEGSLDLNIVALEMEKTTIENITGSLCLNKEAYNIQDFAFEVFEGQGLFSCAIAPMTNKERNFNGSLKFDKLNLKEMMREMEDFDQDYLSGENLEGILNVNLLLATKLDKSWYAKKNKTEAWADVELLKGKLLNFEPMMEMMDLKDKKRMQRIEFQPIRNQFVVKNRSVKIPRMDIKSNLVNVEFSGRHNLNNSVHYHFKVDLLDYFSKRFFKKNPEDAVEKNKKGGINYYFSLFEEASDPVFKKGNKKMVLQQFRKDAVFKPINIDQKVADKYRVLWECKDSSSK